MAKGCRIVTGWQRPAKELVEAFRGIPVANIDDCMNRTAAIHHSIRPLNRSALLGPAFTVKVAEGDNLMFHKAMDMAEPGDVIMIDAGGDPHRAIFGGLMASYCKVRGLNGIVVDGSIRDAEELQEMEDFAVYAKGATPNGPYKNGPGEIGSVICVGGIVVHPGDIVVGDQDGVVVIRPEDAEEIAKAARGVVEKEAKIAELIATGSYVRPWVDAKLEEIGCEYIEL